MNVPQQVKKFVLDLSEAEYLRQEKKLATKEAQRKRKEKQRKWLESERTKRLDELDGYAEKIIVWVSEFFQTVECRAILAHKGRVKLFVDRYENGFPASKGDITCLGIVEITKDDAVDYVETYKSRERRRIVLFDFNPDYMKGERLVDSLHPEYLKGFAEAIDSGEVWARILQS